MLDRVAFERDIRNLEAFGHRGSATQNEREAAKYLLGRLHENGLTNARIEPFYGMRSLPGTVLWHLAIGFVGLLLFEISPWITIVAGVATVLSFCLEQNCRGVWLSRALPHFPSANVVATIPAANRKRRVVLLAHYDTQRTGLIWVLYRYLCSIYWFTPAIMKASMTIVTASFGAQVILGIIAVAGLEGEWFWYAQRLLQVVYVGTIFFFAEWLFHSHVPGAGDNATGSAAIMTMASAWQENPHDDVELMIVFTGCEEAGMLGAEQWTLQHAAEIEATPTLFLNMDNLGFGPPRFLGNEAPNCGGIVSYPKPLLKLAEEVAREAGLADAGPHAVPAATDGLPLLTHGMQGLTIISFSHHGFMPNYHRMQDTTANLDFDAAWAATEFGWRVCGRLAEL